MNNIDIDAFIENAIREDIGSGDHTSLACIPEKAEEKATLYCKENGILAGIELARHIFKHIDPSLQLEVYKKDGDPIRTGDIAFIVKGNTRSILQAERLVLNCMQRMSGIATATRRLTEKTGNHNTKILDTRKTTPGFRAIEKWAVKIGGGVNHRFGLYDMIMIKDNHIDSCGGITAAIRAAVKYLDETGLKLKIEVETRNLDEVKEVLKEGGIDRIMLDNFSPGELAKAIQLIAGKYETEASGGITEDTIETYAATGVDYISVGALTHQINSLDMSLKTSK